MANIKLSGLDTKTMTHILTSHGLGAYTQLAHYLDSLLEDKDPYTARHSNGVRRIAVRIARKMGLAARDVAAVDMASGLHDIGKLLVDSDIIFKPAALTAGEYRAIRQHPQISYDIIWPLTQLDEKIKLGVLHHHERYDGKGYPAGLSGAKIPLVSRIIAVADTYDAIISTRPYRAAQSHQAAMDEVLRHTGTQFDPIVVKAFTLIDHLAPEEDVQVLFSEAEPDSACV